MANLSLNLLFSFLLSSVLLLITLFPATHALPTVAISETGNQTIICAITQTRNSSSQFLNCTSFPQRNQIQLNYPFTSISGVVGGNGFLCAMSTFYSVPSSVMVCWRFSNVTNVTSNMSYRRIYNGSVLTELESGNSRVCGVTNGSSSPQCWPQRSFDSNGEVFSSNLAVGEDFVCGLSNSGVVRCLGGGGNGVDQVARGNFTQIAAGFREACGVGSNGSVECWGNVTAGRPEGEVRAIALGQNRGCAMRINETVVCWGENGFGLPGSLRDEQFVAIEAKQRIFCGVVKSNYSLFCWGDDGFDSNQMVLTNVIPGPCRTQTECAGQESLPNYAQFCTGGLMICLPRVQQELPTPMPTPMPPMPPAPSPSATRSGGWSRTMVVLVVVGSVGSFSFLLSMCILVFTRYFKVRGSRIHDSGRLEQGESGPQINPQPAPPVLEKKLSHMISMGTGGHMEEFPLELLLKVTDNFSEDHKIGSGSFGSVYHAILENGSEVAIKRAETAAAKSAGTTGREQEDTDNAFLNELEFLSRLNHKNLVRLLGFCEDCKERVLVYEYMHNGTLYDHLHKLEYSPLMSWIRRIKAALDAARGIEYLHEFAVPRIIHRDIKSSNILLDSTWTAKVSDFGLSLLGPQGDEDHLSLNAAGTMGYVDPEYYRCQMLTSKSDVYSFGIVLLELLSGKKAIHKNENGVPRNVVDYAVPFITQDEIHRILDPRVPPPTPFEIEAVQYVGYLAVDCVMPEGCDRPNMSEVVSSLDRALETCLAPPASLSRSTTDSSG